MNFKCVTLSLGRPEETLLRELARVSGVSMSRVATWMIRSMGEAYTELIHKRGKEAALQTLLANVQQAGK